MQTRWCATPDDTYALGRALGHAAPSGTVVSLAGDLGAGKTVLARGIAAGLGVTTRVQSPTFVIVQAHEGGRVPFWHADLYRVGDESELDALGLDEILAGAGVVVVEWGDRFVDALPADRLEIRLVDENGGRRVELHGTGPRHAILEAVA